MATKFTKIYHIDATEEQVWKSLLNEHNLEKTVDLDSKNQMHPRKGHRFIWDFGPETIEGTLEKVDSFRTSSTQIIFKWKYQDEDDDLAQIWPRDHYATTTLILGDQTNRTYIQMIITDIPGPSSMQDRARKLWGERIIEKLQRSLESDEELELEDAY